MTEDAIIRVFFLWGLFCDRLLAELHLAFQLVSCVPEAHYDPQHQAASSYSPLSLALCSRDGSLSLSWLNGERCANVRSEANPTHGRDNLVEIPLEWFQTCFLSLFSAGNSDLV